MLLLFEKYLWIHEAKQVINVGILNSKECRCVLICGILCLEPRVPKCLCRESTPNPQRRLSFLQWTSALLWSVIQQWEQSLCLLNFFSQFTSNVCTETGCNHTSFSATLPRKLRVCALSVCLDVKNSTIWEKMVYIPSPLKSVARQSNKGKALCGQNYQNYSVNDFVFYKTLMLNFIKEGFKILLCFFKKN